MAAITFPNVLNGEFLYRCHYKTTAADRTWAYEYDLRRHLQQYECRVMLTATTQEQLARAEHEDLERLLTITDQAMHDLNARDQPWIATAPPKQWMIERQKILTCRAPLSELINNIIRELPRLHDALITAYYC